MRKLSLLLSAIFLLAYTIGCEQDDKFVDFTDSVVAPSNLAMLFDVSSDNSGNVKLTPSAEGASSFDIDFGDGSEGATDITVGSSVEHIFTEGSFVVILTAKGLNDLNSTASFNLDVTFKAPENLTVTIENDPVVSKKVNVIATADYAINFEVYFGEQGNDSPVTANIGEVASYVYSEAGTYSIRVVAKGPAIATAEYTVDFEAIVLVQPTNSAPNPPQNETNVISIFSDKYTNIDGANYFPDWGQGNQGSSWSEFQLNGDNMLQYANLSYQGMDWSSNPQNVSSMEYIHLDVYTAEVANLRISLISQSNGERAVETQLIQDSWTSIDIPITEFTSQNNFTINDIFQIKLESSKFFAGNGADGTIFVDNVYFWKKPAGVSPLVGSWKLATNGLALGVGPNLSDLSWWNYSVGGGRPCIDDDLYVFNADGTFQNVLGSDTWVEGWQGASPDGCGSPVAPHDGSSQATWSSTDTTVTLNGVGAYLGIPKVTDTGELSTPNDAPSSITYQMSLSNDNNTLEVHVDLGWGVWYYKFERLALPPNPLVGSWKLATNGLALGVGPNLSDLSWWNYSVGGGRPCIDDDLYVFNADGTFQNVLGSDTWVEGWQGASPDGCGSPVAPHDGSSQATWSSTDTTVTLNGVGAYLGIPKVTDTGELSTPNDAPSSITYQMSLSNDNNTLEVHVDLGWGVWYYKFEK